MPISKSIIEAAIVGFEHQKIQIASQLAELRAMLSGGPTQTTEVSTPEATPGKRRKVSAAARRKMALAQKARWAKIKGESEPAAPIAAEVPKAKRKLSAAAKAVVGANLKKARAAKAAKAQSATKKATPAPAQAQKPKRKLSAAGRAAIIAATKKMWAAKRAAAKQA
jgi:hypothetical protein